MVVTQFAGIIFFQTDKLSKISLPVGSNSSHALDTLPNRETCTYINNIATLCMSQTAATAC